VSIIGNFTVFSSGGMGWMMLINANTNCSTTCTYGCVVGYDDGLDQMNDCYTAQSDRCLCAGPN